MEYRELINQIETHERNNQVLKEDTENFLIDLDHEHVFELQCDEKNYVLAARSEQEKSQWLCLLMYIRNKR